MGMAASQARWLGLAARKTNVEYEGQQINQARTALANQSSELWNSLYKMDVPTPPSKSDFSTTQYSFQNGDATQTISSIQEADYIDSDGIRYNSYVTYYSQVSEYKGIRNTKSNPQVQYVSNPDTGDGYYMVGTKKVTALASVPGDEDKKRMWETYSAALDQISQDWPEAQVSKDWLAYKGGNSEALNNIYLWSDADNKVNFTSKTASTNDGLDACIQDTTLPLHSYYTDYQSTNKENSKYGIVDYDASGRATNLQLEGSSATYQLTASSITDDNAYEDAMNQYNYEQQVYEKNVQDINAKTEQIQTEDRTLELRLKALDTEQNALQQEMDVVHKIISKNIEATFKTFES